MFLPDFQLGFLFENTLLSNFHTMSSLPLVLLVVMSLAAELAKNSPEISQCPHSLTAGQGQRSKLELHHRHRHLKSIYMTTSQ